MIENVIQNFRCGSRHDPFGHISVVDMISFATFFQQHLRNYNFCDGISAFVFLLGNFAVQFISSRNSQPQVGKKNQVISLVSHFVIRIVIKLNLSHFIPRYSMHFWSNRRNNSFDSSELKNNAATMNDRKCEVCEIPRIMWYTDQRRVLNKSKDWIDSSMLGVRSLGFGISNQRAPGKNGKWKIRNETRLSILPSLFSSKV